MGWEIQSWKLMTSWVLLISWELNELGTVNHGLLSSVAGQVFIGVRVLQANCLCCRPSVLQAKWCRPSVHVAGRVFIGVCVLSDLYT
jgi:hypothetical protein